MAITSVYRVIAVWMPVTVVPTSSATVAIATFITELSNVMRNWPAASVIRTVGPACATSARVLVSIPTPVVLFPGNRVWQPYALGFLISHGRPSRASWLIGLFGG